MSEKHIDEISGVETTGHEWDGIRELNNPMPRWWVITFYLTIIWAVGYMIAYPAWPLINSATKGVLGYSSRAEVAKELSAAQEAQAQYVTRIAQMPVGEISSHPDLLQFAVAAVLRPSRSIASSATALAHRVRPVIRTLMTTAGFGAVILTQFIKP